MKQEPNNASATRRLPPPRGAEIQATPIAAKQRIGLRNAEGRQTKLAKGQIGASVGEGGEVQVSCQKATRHRQCPLFLFLYFYTS